METTVYIDVLFFINFSMDFITLWLCAVLTSAELSGRRMCLSAAIGALYATLTVAFPASGAVTLLSSALVAAIMAAVAFGISGGAFHVVKSTALIWVTAALLGGVMTALLSMGDLAGGGEGGGGGVLSAVCAASVVGVYLAIRIISSVKDRKTALITARWRDKTVSFRALCDSGNLMRDPICGHPVIPVSEKILNELLGEDITRALISLDSKELARAGISLRIIPRRAESGTGLMGGIIPDSITVRSGNVKKGVRCVLAPRECSADYFAGCGATVPSSLL